MKINKSLFAALTALSFAALTGEASAGGQGIQIGVLTCSVIAGSRVNLLIRSTADVECEFNQNGLVTAYKGETGIALGIDLSLKTNERMAFAVIAASSDVSPGSLAGRYVGGEITASAGLGLGAKALFGGGNKSIGLNPLAVETNTGLGASAGLGFLYLEPKDPNLAPGANPSQSSMNNPPPPQSNMGSATAPAYSSGSTPAPAPRSYSPSGGGASGGYSSGGSSGSGGYGSGSNSGSRGVYTPGGGR